MYIDEETWQRYHDILGRRASKVMAEKAGKGDLPGCAPVGYKNVRNGERCWIELDEPTAPLVRRTFELAAEGELSLRKILQVVTDEGLRSRNGKPLGASSLHAVLTNPFYTGRIRYGEKLLSGNHPPIVDETLFAEAQAALGGRRWRG